MPSQERKLTPEEMVAKIEASFDEANNPEIELSHPKVRPRRRGVIAVGQRPFPPAIPPGVGGGAASAEAGVWGRTWPCQRRHCADEERAHTRTCLPVCEHVGVWWLWLSSL